MEKRFVAFLALAFVILMANAYLNALFRGDAPPVAKQDEKAVGKKDEAGDKDAKDAKRPDDVDEKEKEKVKADDGKSAAPEDEREPEQPVDPLEEEKQPEEKPKLPERWLTLGSADPDDPFRMLVTLTGKGAAIHRLELSSPSYRDLENRAGYLGHLEAVDSPGGAEVRVVGAGTPAALAGMKAGDVVVQAGNQDVANVEDLHREIARTRPGQELVLTVLRGAERLTLTASLIRVPLAVMRPEIENMKMRDLKNIPPDFERKWDQPSLLVTLDKIGKESIAEGEEELPGIDLRDGPWDVLSHSQTEAVFRRELPERGLEILKRYRLEKIPAESLGNPEVGYGLDFQIEIRNVAAAAQDVAYRLDGPTGLPIEGWWYAHKVSRNWSAGGLRDLLVRYENAGPVMYGATAIANGKVDPMRGTSLMYAGIDAQYFAAVLIPKKTRTSDVWFDETLALRLGPPPDASTNRTLVNITSRMISKTHTLEPNAAIAADFQFFAGPKRPAIVEAYGQPADPEVYNLSDLIYYGWPIFAVVARAMLVILHLFYAVFHNYGIAIICLTVLVRGCMFPLSRRQAQNMAKMQELSPEIKRIAEKYKKEPEKRIKAQQDLFRKHSYNPMGGCMLMFVQLPIFLGLYRSLMVSVDLRQAPLISESIRWCSNLAAPDMLFNWKSFMPSFLTGDQGMFSLGPYFNVLPIITVGLFILQQKMFMPPATDEQTRLQQKIMNYMMVFIGILFYKVASGLCIYFIASSLWSIAERKMLKKTTPVADAASSPPPAREPVKTSTNGNPGGGGAKKQKRK